MEKEVIEYCRKNENLCSNPLFLECFLNIFYNLDILENKDINLPPMELFAVDTSQINRVEDLFDKYLVFYEKVLMPKVKFSKFWNIMTLTKSGLSARNIQSILEIAPNVWNHMLAIFKFCFLSNGKLWRIKNRCLLEVAKKRYLREGSTLEIHKVISLALLREKYRSNVVRNPFIFCKSLLVSRADLSSP
jgi:hypothetical protein